MCVYTTLRPYTVNFKCAFKDFPKIERPHVLKYACPHIVLHCLVVLVLVSVMKVKVAWDGQYVIDKPQ